MFILVVLSDGAEHKVAMPPPFADIVAWERYFALPAASLDDPALRRAEWVAFLAWRALARAGGVVGEFDAFLERIERIERGGEDDEPGEAPAPAADGARSE